MRFLIRVLINAAAIVVAAHVIRGIEVADLTSALVAGLVLGLINAVIRPVLLVLTFPLTLLTLGLFIFILNAFCLWLTAALVRGFTIHGFWAGLLGALFISIISWLLTAFVGGRAHRRW
jgi:putative membrane protein